MHTLTSLKTAFFPRCYTDEFISKFFVLINFSNSPNCLCFKYWPLINSTWHTSTCFCGVFTTQENYLLINFLLLPFNYYIMPFFAYHKKIGEMIKLQTERIEDRNRTHGRARSRPYMTEFHKLKKNCLIW